MFLCILLSLGILVSVTLGLKYLRAFFEGNQFERDDIRMDGKVALITGANTGIGKETALDLAQRGATVYMACRDMNKCEEVRLEIIHRTNNKNVHNRHLDLASLESVRKFAKEFLDEENRLDVLINNAGVLMREKHVTKDGFEMTMGTNHLGHFLLTNLLLDLIKKSNPSRIINVSSYGHKLAGKFDRRNFSSLNNFNSIMSYLQSKLANVLFSRALAKRLEGTGVTVNSLHPGGVQTELFRNVNFVLKYLMNSVFSFFLKTPKSGAQTQIRMAVDPDLASITGKYFSDCKEVSESKAAQNDDDAQWLWNESVKLVDLEYAPQKSAKPVWDTV